MVRQGSAKAPSVGSIPTSASNSIIPFRISNFWTLVPQTSLNTGIASLSLAITPVNTMVLLMSDEREKAKVLAKVLADSRVFKAVSCCSLASQTSSNPPLNVLGKHQRQRDFSRATDKSWVFSCLCSLVKSSSRTSTSSPPRHRHHQHQAQRHLHPTAKKSATTRSFHSAPRPDNESFCWHLCSSVKT